MCTVNASTPTRAHHASIHGTQLHPSQIAEHALCSVPGHQNAHAIHSRTFARRRLGARFFALFRMNMLVMIPAPASAEYSLSCLL